MRIQQHHNKVHTAGLSYLQYRRDICSVNIANAPPSRTARIIMHCVINSRQVARALLRNICLLYWFYRHMPFVFPRKCDLILLCKYFIIFYIYFIINFLLGARKLFFLCWYFTSEIPWSFIFCMKSFETNEQLNQIAK